MSYEQANTVVTTDQRWDPENPKYKCCCNHSHVLKGAMIVGILEASAFAALILSCIINLKKLGSDVYGVHFAVSIISAIISGIIIALLFYGLKKEKSKFLLPHLGFQILAIVILFILSIVVIIMLSVGSADALAKFLGVEIGDTPDHTPKSISSALMATGVTAFIAMLVFAFMSAWFFTMVYGAYNYLKDKNMYSLMSNMNAGVIVTGNSAPPPYPGLEAGSYNEIKVDKR